MLGSGQLGQRAEIGAETRNNLKSFGTSPASWKELLKVLMLAEFSGREFERVYRQKPALMKSKSAEHSGKPTALGFPSFGSNGIRLLDMGGKGTLRLDRNGQIPRTDFGQRKALLQRAHQRIAFP